MIEIKNLTKVFKSKNKSVVVALNDINLTLPDSGLVFIIGKSGSGKSTLLNMLGGLDKATAGQVIADVNNISPAAKYLLNWQKNCAIIRRRFILPPSNCQHLPAAGLNKISRGYWAVLQYSP